ncbi:MAG TPA: single-stranded DNA-binding protein [Streptosporangiaceae bacterium]|nr:single-stranded DNA-binding protein [Streptosporangiaceae bacterium]
MLNEAQISLTGYVATQPVTRQVKPGVSNVSMRVAWTPRRQDRVTGEWVDGNTSYVTVICWRKLGTNVAICVRKGDPVVVKGRLSVRPYADKEGVPRISVEVDANSVGHDLSRGVASFQRVRPQTGMTASEFAAANAPANGQAADGQAADGQGNGHGMSAAPAFGSGSGYDSSAGSADSGSADPGPAEPEPSFFDESAISEQDAAQEPAAVPF